jgi:DNA repair and recombination protein RadB
MLQRIPTDCVSIDRILEGGLPSGSVSLIYGEAETGKTTLAMQCVVNCARKGYKTLFIDCDGTFSARRLSQIAAEHFKEILELVILVRPENFHEQTVFIDKLTEYITKNFGLIVIDTLTSLYRLKIAESPDKTFELNRDLNRQTALLAQVARTQKIAVLATSQVRSIFNDANMGVEPVATRVLKFWADTILMMKPTERPGIIRVVLEKSPKGTQSLTFDSKIDNMGIHDYYMH